MEEKEIQIIEFDEELYKKNIQENDFSEKIIDGIGTDKEESVGEG